MIGWLSKLLVRLGFMHERQMDVSSPAERLRTALKEAAAEQQHRAAGKSHAK